jgi:hypothetical protein
MSRSRRAFATAAAVAIAAMAGCGPRAHLAAATPRPASSAEVRSSILDGVELTRPVRWQAAVTGIPARDVAAVRFLIDGKLRHLALTAPYLFAGRGNLLLPGTLGSGSHIFAVDVTLTNGHHLTTATVAVVSATAPGVPRQVLGPWTRTVTAADVARTQDLRDQADPVPLPAGTWQVSIGADGVARYTDPAPAHDLTVGQVRFEPGGRLVIGNQIPDFPHASPGGFCGDTADAGIYHWSLRGDALTIRVVSDRQCANRNSFWNGTFTRSDPRSEHRRGT